MHKLYRWIGARRFSQASKKRSLKDQIYSNRYYIISILILLVLSLASRALLVLSVFWVVDYLRNIIKCMVAELPIDTSFYFIVLASFYYTPLFGIVIYLIGLLNRGIFGHLEPRHFPKTIRMIIISFLTNLFSRGNFLYVAILMLVLNELMQMVWDFAVTQNYNFKTILYYILHFSISITSFYLLYEVRFFFV